MRSIVPAYGGCRVGAKCALAILLFMFGLVAPGRAETLILVLGDSLSAGYGLARGDGFQPRLAAALANAGQRQVRLVDAAVSGDTTAGGRARLAWAMGNGVDAAIVELGGNDGLRGVDLRAMEANLIAILDELAARRIPVLLTGMHAPPNMGADYARAFHDVFRKLGTRPGVIFDPFFLEGVAGDPTLNLPDRIHPNAAGVQRIVARILPLVQRLVVEAGK